MQPCFRTMFAGFLGCLLLCGADTPKAASTPTDSVPNSDQPVKIEPRKSTVPEPVTRTRAADIRVNKTLVLINVTVTDPLNRFVTGLEREHFRLFEDKVEQEISDFSAE